MEFKALKKAHKGKAHYIFSKDSYKVFFRSADVLHIFRIGETSNDKIALPEETIVQTYHFSRQQFELANSGTEFSMEDFFRLDGSVCFDCPFAVSNGAKLSACYTHKVMQYSGFLSSLKSVGAKLEWDSIPEYSEDIYADIVSASAGLYVRFGTYGEPSLIHSDLVGAMCAVAKNHTGYTHQWAKKPEYASFFMASVHSLFGADVAEKIGYRSFIATKEAAQGAVNCPASKEAGFKSTCSKCGLCSGSAGKGKKSVWILQH